MHWTRRGAVEQIVEGYRKGNRPCRWLATRIAGEAYMVIPLGRDFVEVTPENIDDAEECNVDIEAYLEQCFG